MGQRVAIDINGGVATVRMCRADKRNALDLAMFEAMIAAGERLRDDRSVRAVVLHGEGPSFCAGLDFASMMASPDSMGKLLARDAGSPANVAQRVAWIWQEVPVPVIAAVQGHALGGGLQIALAADMRYTTPDAKWSVMEMKWGLIPDMSITQTLPRLVRQDVARELTYTGRVLSGSEAAELGLATRVSDDPLALAQETATLIASKSPHAVRAGKALWDRAPDLDRAAALVLETELQLTLLGQPNQLEAITANMERRDAKFSDPE